MGPVASSDITLVIPTLGGVQLEETVAAINRGTLVPRKLLICIPSGIQMAATLAAHENLEIVRTGVRGQVAQRAIGLARADSPYIVQLDDDILLYPDCLEKLVESAHRVGGPCVISPSFINPDTGVSLYRINTGSVLKKCYFWLLNGRAGYAPGTVTKAGTAFGIDTQGSETPEMEVEWIPGGCVLQEKENVVTENFFPFPGKAYTEDMYFSRIARKKGLKLYISRDARCDVEPAPPSREQNMRTFFRELSADMKARRQYVRDTGRSLARMYCYYGIQLLLWLAGKAG